MRRVAGASRTLSPREPALPPAPRASRHTAQLLLVTSTNCVGYKHQQSLSSLNCQTNQVYMITDTKSMVIATNICLTKKKLVNSTKPFFPCTTTNSTKNTIKCHVPDRVFSYEFAHDNYSFYILRNATKLSMQFHERCNTQNHCVREENFPFDLLQISEA